MVRIILADDHVILRQGLRTMLEANSDFTIIGEASDGTEAVSMAETLRPDLIVMDAAMPGLNGIDATNRIKSRSSRIKVLILSMHRDESYVLRALRNGADGYVLKHETAAVLVNAINDVMAGRRYLSPPLSEQVVKAYVQKSLSMEVNGIDKLTTREREILQLVAEGRSNAEISERLFISTRTVETHRTNLMRKLEIKSQAELILFAFRAGIINTT